MAFEHVGPNELPVERRSFSNRTLGPTRGTALVVDYHSRRGTVFISKGFQFILASSLLTRQSNSLDDLAHF